MPELPLEHVHVRPDEPTDGAPAPAVVVLHGRGADERDLLPVAASLPASLHVVSLRAPDPLQGGYTWYDLDLSAGGLHQSQPNPTDFERSVRLVEDAIAGAVDAYDLDPDRLGLLGFSQGAITSLSLLLESPSRYAWVVGLHGYLPDSHGALEPSDVEGRRVFVGAGDDDQVIPAHRSAAAADRLTALGAAVTHETYPTGHGIGRDELTDVVAFVESSMS